MKTSLRFLLLIFTTIIVQVKIYGQGVGQNQPKAYPSKHDTLRQYKTDIFVLHACSTDDLSFQRYGYGNKQNNEVPVRKLSINANRFSSFRIDQINPLRYSFYVNSESVTKFVDASDDVIGTFKKDTANIQASNIDILDIFPSDSLYKKQSDASVIKDSIDRFHSEYTELFNTKWSETYYSIQRLISRSQDPLDPNLTAIDPKNDSALAASIDIRDKISGQLDAINKKDADEINKYTLYLSSLVINNNVEGIIKDILSKPIDTMGFTNAVKAVSARLDHQVMKSLENIGVINTTLTELQKFTSSNQENFVPKDRAENTNYDSLNTHIDSLNTLIDSILPFAFNKSFSISRSALFDSNSINRQLERNKIFEYVTSEKLNQVNYFVLYSSLQIGKLLQTAFTENSRVVNKLNYQNCINIDLQDEIDSEIETDTRLYNYIQNISSNLNVLIKYAQLNNPAFNTTIKGINDDYKTFLKYIKVLDFLDSNNTVQFTLPSSTNLSNVDIIRYSVNKRDRLSGREENYTYDLWLKGGLKVDFSVAILISGLNDYSYNKDALFKVSDTSNSSGTFVSTQRTDSFLIKRQSTGKYNFAFGGMVNVMLRSGASWITPGASVGIAYGSATNSKLQFLGSLSLQFGKSERIIAHFGIVAGEAQRLDISQLTYNQKTDILDGGNTFKVKGDFSTTPIPTTPNFLFRPFFGISYSLSKKNALNAVGSNADNYNHAFPK